MKTPERRHKICSKLTIKTPERRFTPCSTVSVVNFEHVIVAWGAFRDTCSKGALNSETQ